jgi:hypothetical protein
MRLINTLLVIIIAYLAWPIWVVGGLLILGPLAHP